MKQWKKVYLALHSVAPRQPFWSPPSPKLTPTASKSGRTLKAARKVDLGFDTAPQHQRRGDAAKGSGAKGSGGKAATTGAAGKKRPASEAAGGAFGGGERMLKKARTAYQILCKR